MSNWDRKAHLPWIGLFQGRCTSINLLENGKITTSISSTRLSPWVWDAGFGCLVWMDRNYHMCHQCLPEPSDSPLVQTTVSNLSTNPTSLARVTPTHLGLHSSMILVLPSPLGKWLVTRSSWWLTWMAISAMLRSLTSVTILVSKNPSYWPTLPSSHQSPSSRVTGWENLLLMMFGCPPTFQQLLSPSVPSLWAQAITAWSSWTLTWYSWLGNPTFLLYSPRYANITPSCPVPRNNTCLSLRSISSPTASSPSSSNFIRRQPTSPLMLPQ